MQIHICRTEVGTAASHDEPIQGASWLLVDLRKACPVGRRLRSGMRNSTRSGQTTSEATNDTLFKR